MGSAKHGPSPRRGNGPAVAPSLLDREVEGLRAENDALRQSSRLKDQYLSVAAHELAAPLAAMKAYIEALREHHADPQFEQTGEFLAVLERETDRLIRVVERTLEISRLAARGAARRHVAMQLAAVVADVVPPLRPRLTERATTLDVRVSPDLPLVRADADQIQQVLLNLIHNAIKFSAPGKTVSLVARAVPGAVEVEVRDQGWGIAPEELDRVFEPYFRSGDERVERERGTGLGLSIVKTIVEQHGGCIRVESAVEQGTSFRFTLPRA